MRYAKTKDDNLVNSFTFNVKLVEEKSTNLNDKKDGANKKPIAFHFITIVIVYNGNSAYNRCD